MGKHDWQDLCAVEDLVPGSGVAARLGKQQIALFYLPQETPAVYAIDNQDPKSGANVISRGIVGDIGGELVVASPLYKQHYRLRDGRCLEEDHRLNTYAVRLDGGRVWLAACDDQQSAA